MFKFLSLRRRNSLIIPYYQKVTVHKNKRQICFFFFLLLLYSLSLKLLTFLVKDGGYTAGRVETWFQIELVSLWWEPQLPPTPPKGGSLKLLCKSVKYCQPSNLLIREFEYFYP